MRYIVKESGGKAWTPDQCSEDDAGLICEGERLPREKIGTEWLVIESMSADEALHESQLYRVNRSDDPEDIELIAVQYANRRISLLADGPVSD